MAPAVTVVVPLFNGRDLVGDCLRSVPDWAETVVVDDGSTDGAPELVEREFPTARVLRNDRNRGFGATCNRGMAAANAPICVLLNSDARLRPGALEALVAAVAPGIGIVGARRVFPDGTHQTSAASFPTPVSIFLGSFLVGEIHERLRPGRPFRWQLGMPRAAHDHDADVDWVTGTCLAITADCIRDTGGFDEGYHLYAEETDLCWRARQAGWRVRFVAGAVVEHLGGGSTGDPVVHAQRALRSEARFMARAHGEEVLPRWRLARVTGAAVKAPLLAAAAVVDRRARARLRWQLSALRTAAGGGWRPELPVDAPRSVLTGTAPDG